MPEAITTDTAHPVATPEISAETTHEIDTVGIEFEYPTVASTSQETPWMDAARSRSLRDAVGVHNDWILEGVVDNNIPIGKMTSDHVGAEITSDQLRLHSTEPELWHAGTIETATEMGHPFAPTGLGETNFGAHLHLSEIPPEKAEFLYEISTEPWFRMFVCTSMKPGQVDPWRHGGVSSRDMREGRPFDAQYIVKPCHGTGHYEWRLPEPTDPQHFAAIMHFLRLLDIDGTEAAQEYAENLVFGGDTRLMAVRQYNYLKDNYDTFPHGVAHRDERYTTPEVADRIIDIME